MKSGVENDTLLFNIPDAYKPTFNDVMAPLYYSDGSCNSTGSVWIEYSNRNAVKYFGQNTTTANQFVSLMYVINS